MAKRVVRTCVQEMKLAPESLEVEITYRLPEPVMNGLVAGACFVSEKKTRPCPWEREIPFRLRFERDLRPGERPKPRHLRVVGGAKKAKVAGSKRGRLATAAR